MSHKWHIWLQIGHVHNKMPYTPYFSLLPYILYNLVILLGLLATNPQGYNNEVPIKKIRYWPLLCNHKRIVLASCTLYKICMIKLLTINKMFFTFFLSYKIFIEWNIYAVYWSWHISKIKFVSDLQKLCFFLTKDYVW